MNYILFILFGIFATAACAQTPSSTKKINEPNFPKAFVNYNDFKDLVTVVEKHRADRLLNFEAFLKMSQEKNVVVLDSRSEFRFKRIHLKGAKHLAFTDFTQDNLAKLIPDLNTKILIYCNNNFEGNPVDFASKIANPQSATEAQVLSNRKPVMLALNIPTYINLYGYGYKNVFELYELVNVNDPRASFEGSIVKKKASRQ